MTTVGRSPRNEGMGALLERDRELREAAALLADVRADRGRMLLIEAPPGLGKSNLVDHIGALAVADGVRVVTAAGRELEQGLGWGVARSLFEPWLFSVPAAERDELQSGPAESARVSFEPGGNEAGRPASEVTSESSTASTGWRCDSPSELRVAELAAAGRTNREIANELFVTVKAVEWHLGNAYRKLDIRGRGDLARALG